MMVISEAVKGRLKGCRSVKGLSAKCKLVMVLEQVSVWMHSLQCLCRWSFFSINSLGKICTGDLDSLWQLVHTMLPGRNHSPDLGVFFPSAACKELLAPEN